MFGEIVEKTAHSIISDLHAPELTGKRDMERLIGNTFTIGALVSSRHNSFRNRLGSDKNEAVRLEPWECGGIQEATP